MRYFALLSFRGADYCGWQIQQNGPSIQAEITDAISVLLGTETGVTGAGRTDAGVNAENYIIHFDTPQDNTIKEPRAFLYKLNAILSKNIVIKDLFAVPDTAHARFDALSRTYRYDVHTFKDPFGIDFSYPFYRELDIEKMNRAAQHLIGTRDFSSFEKLHGGSTSSICTLTEAGWEEIGNGKYRFTITANRFLRNMVRAIVGSLLETGCGKREPEWICELMEKHNRCAAGQSVPGNALFLCDIKYPYELKSIL